MASGRLKILIVEDDADLRAALATTLGASGHAVTEADGVESGVAAFREAMPDVALLDHGLSDGDVFDLLRALPLIDPTVPLVVLTGRGSIGVAVQAMKQGAQDFVEKPVTMPHLLRVLEEAVEARRRRGGSGRDDESGLTLREMERRHIVRALETEGRRVVAAAKRLGIPRSTMYQKLKEFGIQAPRARRRNV